MKRIEIRELKGKDILLGLPTDKSDFSPAGEELLNGLNGRSS